MKIFNIINDFIRKAKNKLFNFLKYTLPFACYCV